MMSKNLVMQDTLLMQDNSAADLSFSAGQMLRKARTDAGLHIAALAVSLHVPVKRIEALENGRMDLLPDMVFVRALTSSICQTLKIDAAPILEKLPKAAVPRLNRDDVALNTPIAVNTVGKNTQLADTLTLPWIFGVALLIMGAAGIYLWPQTSGLVAPLTTTSTKNLTDAGVSQAKELQIFTENSVTSAQKDSGSVILPSGITSPTESSSLSSSVISSSAENVTVPASLAVATIEPAAESIVIFRASSDAWVEVKDAKGVGIFKKLLKSGETAGANGALPLTVIVGRADVTQVEVRGKLIDLTAIAKSNVARFEVN